MVAYRISRREPPPPEEAMEWQTAIKAARAAGAPVWEHAIAAGWETAGDAKLAAEYLQRAERLARKITGRLEALVQCGDGIVGVGHGRAS